MRQAGIRAAAGLYALDNNRKRLPEDHHRARQLARALQDTSWFSVDPESITSNIVYFNVANNAAHEAVNRLKAHDVLVSATTPAQIRAVTHINISDADLQRTIAVLCQNF